ncbi:MAG: hypothetical protein F4089_01600 [Gammaproteobacteria bacterium]|nr:hypothetical protein [Gammaproteobacteria bacterium]MYJ73847.1 hypothetical protein [Gammaproteobacteria bacterium]
MTIKRDDVAIGESTSRCDLRTAASSDSPGEILRDEFLVPMNPSVLVCSSASGTRVSGIRIDAAADCRGAIVP